jgi:LacI family transcriptional regulator, repressor for deo operon, udp, cdd, tsx, nupC, and nupG
VAACSTPSRGQPEHPPGGADGPGRARLRAAGAGIDAPFISTDDHEAMTLAVGHLVQLRHRRIGLAVGPDRFVPSQGQGGGRCDGTVVDAGRQPRKGTRLGRALPLLGRGRARDSGQPAGPRGHGDRLRFRPHGPRRVPGAARQQSPGGVPLGVSVVGFDDSPLVAFTDPPLTRCASRSRRWAPPPYGRCSTPSRGSRCRRRSTSSVANSSSGAARPRRRHRCRRGFPRAADGCVPSVRPYGVGVRPG